MGGAPGRSQGALPPEAESIFFFFFLNQRYEIFFLTFCPVSNSHSQNTLHCALTNLRLSFRVTNKAYINLIKVYIQRLYTHNTRLHT